MKDTVLLEMKNITKQFPGIKALDGVDFDLQAGEVHALLGENGAGKSTLIKILGGIYPKDGGDILINGTPVDIHEVNNARDLGISVIHQELVLVPQLSVAENIFLGREPRKRNRLIDFDVMRKEAGRILSELDLSIDPDKRVWRLSIAQQQMVEVAKAISFNAKIIVMDEPTSSITSKDVDALFTKIRRLRSMGIGIIYISHRMSELQEIADRVTVLRDGKYVATKKTAETSNDELIALMVGRAMTNYYTRTYNKYPEIILKVDHMTTPVVHDISFELKKGEILGFSGLIGAGRTEAILGLMGLHEVLSGKIYLEGKELSPKLSVRNHIRKGMALVPEDRKGEGIFPLRSLRFNMTLKVLGQFIKGVVNNLQEEHRITDNGIEKLSIRSANDLVPIGLLSGGNQQKVILASWLATNPKILILDEPTKGIDVGAKGEIYEIMNELAKAGVAIIMISSELPEVINMSDRVVVMREGRIQKILDQGEISQETIMQYAVAI
ncbi:sugar ABC transporter ATP-binding protein [Treponema primitia]|uniref:sugar ABC transporter ATP-binding protein n=1 Tax=Treponema primitia TaxID=88058 RepID=UPI0002554C1A|nr:sugar ABC transporter ATP-binding protein [Treponema primitia]